MSGRLVILIMAIAAIITSVIFYQTLKNSPQQKEFATSQIKQEFLDYAINRKQVEKLKVADQDEVSFFVDITADWNFLIHDKTLVVTAPPLRSEPPGRAPAPETVEIARKSVHAFLFDWLVEKFKTQKNVLVEIRFPDEPLPQ